MRSLHLIVALCLVPCFVAGSCVSNPTPHPSNEDPSDFTGDGPGTAGGGSWEDDENDPSDRDLSNEDGVFDAAAAPNAMGPDAIGGEADVTQDATEDSEDAGGLDDDIGPGDDDALDDHDTLDDDDALDDDDI